MQILLSIQGLRVPFTLRSVPWGVALVVMPTEISGFGIRVRALKQRGLSTEWKRTLERELEKKTRWILLELG
jgi:hypothetical protein